MSDTDLSDAPIPILQEKQERIGDRQMVLQAGYVPPLDGSDDAFKMADQWLARRVAELLTKFYYGYTWYVLADIRQGVVAFSIPVLMGPTLKYVIRLADYRDLTPDLIMRSAGELLERMHLPRKAMDVGAFIAARQAMHTFEFSDVKGSK